MARHKSTPPWEGRELLVTVVDADTILGGQRRSIEMDLLKTPPNRIAQDIGHLLAATPSWDWAVTEATGFEPLDPTGLHLVQLARLAAMAREHGACVFDVAAPFREKVDELDEYLTRRVEAIMPKDEELFCLQMWAAVGPRPSRGGWFVHPV